MQHGIKRHVKNSARRRNLLESHGIFRLHVSRPASISSTPLFLSLVITNHLKVPLSARFVRDCSPPHLAARDSQSQGIFGLQMDLTSNQCNFFFSGLFFSLPCNHAELLSQDHDIVMSEKRAISDSPGQAVVPTSSHAAITPDCRKKALKMKSEWNPECRFSI